MLLRDDPPLALCSRCRPLQVRLPSNLAVRRLGPNTLVRAAWDYDGPLQRAVVALKFHGALALAGPLGRLLAEDPWLRCGPDGEPLDLLIPVPLHWRRRFVRGFDQSLALARWARVHAAGRGLPCPRLASGVLARRRATVPQTDLDAHDREANLGGAFVVRRAERIRGRRILLLDDVTTTGATVRACAAPLLEAGARSVHALALLRAL